MISYRQSDSLTFYRAFSASAPGSISAFVFTAGIAFATSTTDYSSGASDAIASMQMYG